MNTVLKQYLGVDVSKLSLSLSLGSLSSDLNKKFKTHKDVSNDLSGYKVLIKMYQRIACVKQPEARCIKNTVSKGPGIFFSMKTTTPLRPIYRSHKKS